ncbi:MAG: helix-turn-helix domain-containing protein [Eubacteriales bacterium]|nr:helix-turn-helix domain-containing protein [Eubacteriales bacterium]
MYTLIIVDDEVIIRSGLKSSMDWASLNFSVAGVFSCGNDAIRFLQDNTVDAVLTDIRMHDGSGLELAEWVNQHRRNVPVILLTGFSDYEAARRAVACGAVRYLLNKPTPIPEIQQVFSQLAQWLNNRDAVARQENEMKLACLRQVLADQENAEKLWGNMAVLCVTIKAASLGDQRNAPSLYSIEQTRYFPGIARQTADGFAWMYPCQQAYVEEIKRLAAIQMYGTNESEALSFTAAQPFLSWMASSSAPDMTQDGNRYISVVDAYLQENLSNKILLKDVAKKFNYSVSYFCRMFKVWSGMSFSDYLLQYRMEKARGLLKNTSVSIAEIARATGFGDSRYFAHSFKKSNSVSPSMYRRRMIWKE